MPFYLPIFETNLQGNASQLQFKGYMSTDERLSLATVGQLVCCIQGTEVSVQDLVTSCIVYEVVI